MEDYHTHFLGKTSHGKLFWAYETFYFSQPFGSFKNEDWAKYRREYAILHLFDKAGNHVETKSKFTGITADLQEVDTYTVLEEMVRELGQVEYTDIEVKPFSVKIDGVIFGLIPDSETGSIDLQPSSTISFQEPWDGEYLT
ncbi:hypothetical protein TH61_06555 [Rufibacter sp. DG15C]|nr:hypothetical protein TH61_06555 [Rufibacter sp. DG15C]